MVLSRITAIVPDVMSLGESYMITGRALDERGIGVETRISVTIDGTHRFWVLTDENGGFMYKIEPMEQDVGEHEFVFVADEVRSEKYRVSVRR